ncbi:MAG: class I SAM-dependent methyltransferase [Actinomycetes bacterium]
MRFDSHSYAENFIVEDHFKSQARARGVEVGAIDVTPGVGAYLRHLAFTLSAQSVVEVGTGSGVGSLWLLDGIIKSGTLTSIDDEMEHTQIAKLAFADADIAPSRYRLITNSVLDVISKLTDKAYDLVVLRHNPEDLAFVIGEAHRILRSGGALVIDNFFGGSKVNDPAQRDPRTVALRDAGKIIKNDTEHWVSTLIPAGDGLLVATKL